MRTRIDIDDGSQSDALDEGGERQTDSQRPALPSFRGEGVRLGIDLADNPALLDVMDAGS